MIAREEWLADKKNLKDTLVDMTASENLAEYRLTREPDAQAHGACPGKCTFSSSKSFR
jgi:hypothetical protein